MSYSKMKNRHFTAIHNVLFLMKVKAAKRWNIIFPAELSQGSKDRNNSCSSFSLLDFSFFCPSMYSLSHIYVIWWLLSNWGLKCIYLTHKFRYLNFYFCPRHYFFSNMSKCKRDSLFIILKFKNYLVLILQIQKF